MRNTAAGLRYVLYAFATALEDPSRVIAEPMSPVAPGDTFTATFAAGEQGGGAALEILRLVREKRV